MSLWQVDDSNEYEFKTDCLSFEENVYEPHVYIVRIIDQDKLYVGSRTARGCLRTDLGERYFTSSSIVSPIWKEHPDNIEVVELQLCKSNHDAQILEAQMILEFALKDSSYLNRGYSGYKFNMSGSTFSEESRKKLSESRMGQAPWNKDKKGLQSHSEERKKHLSESMKGEKNHFYGRTHSEETRSKIGEQSKNKIITEETRQRMSEANKGRKPWNTGQPLSEEHKQKVSAANTGKKRTDETKRNMSEAAKKRKRLECPHCLKTVVVNVYSRFHGENCKFNQTEGK